MKELELFKGNTLEFNYSIVYVDHDDIPGNEVLYIFQPGDKLHIAIRSKYKCDMPIITHEIEITKASTNIDVVINHLNTCDCMIGKNILEVTLIHKDKVLTTTQEDIYIKESLVSEHAAI